MSMERFIIIPPQELPAEIRRSLLGAFASRQGADSTDTGAGESGWVEELEQQLRQQRLLIVHDLVTESTEVMTQEQWQHFQRHAAEHPDDTGAY